MITSKDNLTLIFVHACGVGNWMWYKQKDYFSNFSCMFSTIFYFFFLIQGNLIIHMIKFKT